MKEKILNKTNTIIKNIIKKFNDLLSKYNINNIKTKLILGISFIVFITTLTIGIIFLTQYRNLSLKKVEKEMLQKSNQLSNLGYLILNNNKGMPNNFYEQLRRITDSDIWVIDKEGNIVASSIQIPMNLMNELNNVNNNYINKLSNKSIITYNYSSFFENKTLSIITPIYQRTFEGAIILHYDVNTIYDSNTYLTVLVIISLIISLMISVLMGIIYSKYFTKPIKLITDVTKRISNRDYDVKVNLNRDDEFGVLGNTIDNMSLEIKENISEIKNLEKRAKDLVANVSHEFKTPLTLIKGHVENLRDNIVKPSNEIYEKILTNTDVLEKLVSELLDLSKFQAGNVILKLENLDLQQLIEDVIDEMDSLAKKKKIKINLKINYKDSQLINADYVKIRQLITIFIDNAIKYSNDLSDINVIIDKNKVTIIDYGKGIEKNKLEQIFERYYQVDSNNKGYGLGLCIAKYIADSHHYNLSINSIENEGTTVEIEITKNIG